MPHRVTTFLRNSSTSIEAQVANIKKATVRRPSPKPQSSSTSTTIPSSSTRRRQQRAQQNEQRPLSYASSLGDDADDHEGAVHDIAPSRTSQSSTSSHTAAPVASPVASPASAPAPTPAPATATAPAPSATTSTTTTSPRPAAATLASTVIVPSMKSVVPQQRTSSTERRDKDHKDHHHHHHHRLSFGALHFGRSSRENHTNPNLKIDWKIESPPIVLYNDAETSTGALVSGLLFLHVKDEPVQLESFVATLHMHVTQKRPYTTHCTDCTHQYTELERWTFLQGGRPKTLTKGEHGFPFSVLLKGNLPASMDGQLVSIAYEFAAEATPVPGTGLPVKLDKLFNVLRSLPAPELPHHSVRIFPPTNIKASVHFPQVIYPLGQYTFNLRMDGVARLNEKANTVEYWKLKKLTWRLEETTKAIAPACARHAPRDVPGLPNSSSNSLSSEGEGQGQGQGQGQAVAATAAPTSATAAATGTTATSSTTSVPAVAETADPSNQPNQAAAAAPPVDAAVAQIEANAAAAAAAAAANAAAVSRRQAVQRKDTRVIGEKTLVTGWKSHYAGPDDSLVEVELEYALSRHARYSCDTRTRDGTEVTHQLMVEMVVSQEWAPANKPGLVTQTGVGRILRMHFNVVLTERGGIGISWDNEAPPIYQDVPPSPPSYRAETAAAAVPDMEPLDGVLSQ